MPESNDIHRADISSVRLIPRWIYNHLLKSGVSPKDFCQPDKVVPHLGTDDLADWMVLNDMSTFSLQIPFNAWPLFEKVGEPTNLIQINNAQNFSFSKAVADRVKERLSGPPREKYKPYEHIPFTSTIWLVVDSGFINVIEGQTSRLEFMRDYLRATSDVAPSKEVSRTAVFRRFVEALVA